MIYITEYNQNMKQYIGHTENYSKVVVNEDQIIDKNLEGKIMGMTALVHITKGDKFYLMGDFIELLDQKYMKN